MSMYLGNSRCTLPQHIYTALYTESSTAQQTHSDRSDMLRSLWIHRGRRRVGSDRSTPKLARLLSPRADKLDERRGHERTGAERAELAEGPRELEETDDAGRERNVSTCATRSDTVSQSSKMVQPTPGGAITSDTMRSSFRFNRSGFAELAAETISSNFAFSSKRSPFTAQILSPGLMAYDARCSSGHWVARIFSLIFHLDTGVPPDALRSTSLTCHAGDAGCFGTKGASKQPRRLLGLTDSAGRSLLGLIASAVRRLFGLKASGVTSMPRREPSLLAEKDRGRAAASGNGKFTSNIYGAL